MDTKDMMRRFKVKLHLFRLEGGIPAHEDVVKGWLAKAKIQDEDLAEQIAAGTITEPELEEKLQKLTTTFMFDEKGQPCYEARCAHAALKQAANVMGLYSARPGIRELIREGTDIVPLLIPVAKNKDDLGVVVKPISVKGPQGPRSAFKRTRFVENIDIEFEIHVADRTAIKALYTSKVPPKKSKGPGKTKGVQTVTQDEWGGIVKFGGKFSGYGSNRSQGCGKGELVSIEELTD